MKENNGKEIRDFMDNMEKTAGKESTIRFIQTMLGLMSTSGFKPATIEITRISIHDLIQEIMTKYVLIKNENKETLNKIEIFFDDIKNQIINFSDSLEREE